MAVFIEAADIVELVELTATATPVKSTSSAVVKSTPLKVPIHQAVLSFDPALKA